MKTATFIFGLALAVALQSSQAASMTKIYYTCTDFWYQCPAGLNYVPGQDPDSNTACDPAFLCGPSVSVKRIRTVSTTPNFSLSEIQWWDTETEKNLVKSLDGVKTFTPSFRNSYGSMEISGAGGITASFVGIG